MRTLCYPSINGKFSARFSVASNFSGLAESNERIGIEHYRLQDDAVALRLRHSALREQLPLIEARRKPVAVLHDFPDTLIVLASKPRSKVCHGDVPPLGFSLKNNSLPQRGKGNAGAGLFLWRPQVLITAEGTPFCPTIKLSHIETTNEG